MSIFGQLKGAQEMLKGMSPDQIKDLLEKAKEQQGMIEEVIRKEVDKIVKERGLVSREEVERMIRDAK